MVVKKLFKFYVVLDALKIGVLSDWDYNGLFSFCLD